MDAPRVHASGRDPDRILVIGSGPAVGFGVASHQLALPGQLARHLARLTGRGADIEVAPDSSMTIASASASLAARPLWRYDAIIITLGVADARRTMSTSRWRTRLMRLLTTVDDACSVGTRVVLVGMQPDDRGSAPAVDGVRRLNAISAELCRSSDRAHFLDLPATQRERSCPTARSSAEYRGWAYLLAAHLFPHLTALATSTDRAVTETARWRRDQPQDDEERQRSLDALQLHTAEDDPVFDRVVNIARAAFGTKYAALALIDRDREWVAASAGFSVTEIPRSESFCAVSILHERPLIVPDARDDLLFFRYSAVERGMVRFYAGYPIEGPDGLRIGALCVFDPDPREHDDPDTSLLRSLAHEVQKRLWHASVRASRVAS